MEPQIRGLSRRGMIAGAGSVAAFAGRPRKPRPIRSGLPLV